MIYEDLNEVGKIPNIIYQINLQKKILWITQLNIISTLIEFGTYISKNRFTTIK